MVTALPAFTKLVHRERLSFGPEFGESNPGFHNLFLILQCCYICCYPGNDFFPLK
jgi:hypothetical protein